MARSAGQVEALKLMRAVAWMMLAVGALACASGLAFKPLTRLGFAVQLVATIGFALGGAAIRVLPPRRRVLELAAIGCILLLCGIVGASNVIGSTTYFFLWPVIYLAYFSSARTTALAFAVMSVGVVIAAALNVTLPDPADTVIGVVSSVGVMAALVVAMGRRQATLSEALLDAAHTDALTGLPNRRAFMPYLDELVARARRGGGSVTLAIFDVDHFKRYNDTYGHLAGDGALARFAELMRDHAPVESRPVRLGGEEFALAFDDVDPRRARACVEAIVRDLRRRSTSDGAGALTASAGVCELSGEIASTEALMQCADTALYGAKAAGRDRVCGWGERGVTTSPEPGPPARRRRLRGEAPAGASPSTIGS